MIKLPTRGEVDRAGEVLRAGRVMTPDWSHAMDILGAWRGLHALPLQAVNMRLRYVVARTCPTAIVARRLKRMDSIVAKLKRLTKHDYKLKASQMQDIGGVRVIVDDIQEVNELRDRIAVKGHRTHIKRSKDYIKQPKSDGYRSLHQIFRYTRSDQPALHNLQIELQIRTRLQHAWATAVETLGIIERTSFKTGQGQAPHKRFFCLASALFSLDEGSPVLADFADRRPSELVAELEQLDDEIRARERLRVLTVDAGQDQPTVGKKNRPYLMFLDTDKAILHKQRMDTPETALAFLNNLERSNANDPTKNALLVSLDNIQNLKQAYPNYYLDASLFLDSLDRVCETYRA